MPVSTVRPGIVVDDVKERLGRKAEVEWMDQDYRILPRVCM